jgi:hypothetical protein
MTENEELSIALIDAEESQVESLKEYLPEIEWRAESPKTAMEDRTPNAVIVFAKTHEEEVALSRCHSLRESNEVTQVPVLVAISIYQMPLGNQVKRLPNCDLVFLSVTEEGPPIEREDLLEKLQGLQEQAQSP